MKYVMVDKYEVLDLGEKSQACKNVPIGECYFPAPSIEPVFSSSLLMESMAQTAGMLISATMEFEAKTVFAKIEEAEFEDAARPGDHIELRARYLENMDRHYRMECEATVGGRRIGRMVAIFTCLDLAAGEGADFDTPEFARARSSMLRSLGVVALLNGSLPAGVG